MGVSAQGVNLVHQGTVCVGEKKIAIRETVAGRNVRRAGSQAWELLQGAQEVIVGRLLVGFNEEMYQTYLK